jgi:hypothetical protein
MGKTSFPMSSLIQEERKMNKVQCVLAGFLFPILSLFLQAVNNPFPHHVAYPVPVIQPSQYTQAQLDDQVKAYYSVWKNRYFTVVPNVTPRQAYINYNLESANSPRNACSVSETHGYGMVIIAYMAGYDAQAKDDFDALVRFYLAHPSLYAKPNTDINPPDHFMCWQQLKDKKGNVYDVTKGPDSATDGDEDIAYSLLLADRQWGSSGLYNYKQMSINIIKDFPRVNMDISLGITNDCILWLGDWVIHNYNSGATKWLGGTRPSDWMFSHYTSFVNALISVGETSTAQTYNTMLNQMYTICNRIFTAFSPNTGLMPDFILKQTKGVFNAQGTYDPAPSRYMETTYDGAYYWNACRCPWRMGTDYVLAGNQQLKAQLQKFNVWSKTKCTGNPANFQLGYTLSGNQIARGTDLAFTAPLIVSNMIPKADGSFDQEWLNTLWDYVKNNPVNVNTDNYGNTIKMQCMIIASGNWWLP